MGTFNYLLSTQCISRIWPRKRTSESDHFEPKIAFCSPHWRLPPALQLDILLGWTSQAPRPLPLPKLPFLEQPVFFERKQGMTVWPPSISNMSWEKSLIKTSNPSILGACLYSFKFLTKWNLSVTLRLWENLSPRKFGQVSKLSIADRPCLPALPAHLVPWYFQDSTCALFTSTFFSVIPSEKKHELSAAPMHAPMESRMGKGDLVGHLGTPKKPSQPSQSQTEKGQKPFPLLNFFWLFGSNCEILKNKMPVVAKMSEKSRRWTFQITFG